MVHVHPIASTHIILHYLPYPIVLMSPAKINSLEFQKNIKANILGKAIIKGKYKRS